jgi:hypothetical protein
MPRAELIFDLPDEEGEFWLASNAGALARAIVKVDNELRNLIKYNPDNLSEDEMVALQRARDILSAELEEGSLLRVFSE